VRCLFYHRLLERKLCLSEIRRKLPPTGAIGLETLCEFTSPGEIRISTESGLRMVPIDLRTRLLLRSRRKISRLGREIQR
jgi:hypothetical protein